MSSFDFFIFIFTAMLCNCLLLLSVCLPCLSSRIPAEEVEHQVNHSCILRAYLAHRKNLIGDGSNNSELGGSLGRCGQWLCLDGFGGVLLWLRNLFLLLVRNPAINTCIWVEPRTLSLWLPSQHQLWPLNLDKDLVPICAHRFQDPQPYSLVTENSKGQWRGNQRKP